MIIINGKFFRNLQEQVLYLTELIEAIKPYIAGSGISIDGSTISADSTIQRKPTAIDYPHGGPSLLTYDTTDGVAMEGNARLTTDQGIQDVPLTTRIPIKPGNNVTIDTDAAGEFVVISAANGSKIDTVSIDDLDMYDRGEIDDPATVAKLIKPTTLIFANTYHDEEGSAQYKVLSMVARDYDGSVQEYTSFVYGANEGGVSHILIITPASDLSTATWEYTKIASPRAVHLTIPSGATQGTITAEQLENLQSNDRNYIVINDTEIYLLQDKGHTTGIWTYTHEGYEGSGKAKYLNLTIATRAFTIVESRSLTLPASAPPEEALVTVGPDNKQSQLFVGDGLRISANTITTDIQMSLTGTTLNIISG